MMHEYFQSMDLLKFVAAGSVDDGKSTLIGRLLFDTGQIFEDQLEALKKKAGPDGEVDLSLLTDGLAAEREQRITIDVAYRYFATKKRRFIIADVPGHEQYTRNMVTGASHAQVALILIDARKGLLGQTKRHLFAASLLRIPHIAIVINKMDLVGFDEVVFEQIKGQVTAFAAKLKINDLQFIPASAYTGDMVVERKDNMPWYGGRTILDYLEQVEVSGDRNLIDFRLPVQMVFRPNQDFRGYAGTLAGGVIRVGEEVIALPSGKRSKVTSIYVGDQKKEFAMESQSVVLTLEDEIDISRGDMIARPKNTPQQSNYFDAFVSWFDAEPMRTQKRYILKQVAKETSAVVSSVVYHMDVETLHRTEADILQQNEVGRVTITTNDPLLFDPYGKNKHTGSFILIDEFSGNTVGAGMIISSNKQVEKPAAVVKEAPVLWFTGLSGSGKSTIADAVYEELKKQGKPVQRLDGDLLREHISKDLGFSEEGRRRNIEIAGFVAGLLSKHGITVLASFITPTHELRTLLRNTIPEYKEIFIDTPLEICEERDVKGLYKQARNGEIEDFTGISSPYERPIKPDIHIQTVQTSVEEAAAHIVKKIISQ